MDLQFIGCLISGILGAGVSLLVAVALAVSPKLKNGETLKFSVSSGLFGGSLGYILALTLVIMPMITGGFLHLANKAGGPIMKVGFALLISFGVSILLFTQMMQRVRFNKLIMFLKSSEKANGAVGLLCLIVGLIVALHVIDAKLIVANYNVVSLIGFLLIGAFTGLVSAERYIMLAGDEFFETEKSTFIYWAAIVFGSISGLMLFLMFTNKVIQTETQFQLTVVSNFFYSFVYMALFWVALFITVFSVSYKLSTSKQLK